MVLPLQQMPHQNIRSIVMRGTFFHSLSYHGLMVRTMHVNAICEQRESLQLKLQVALPGSAAFGQKNVPFSSRLVISHSPVLSK